MAAIAGRLGVDRSTVSRACKHKDLSWRKMTVQGYKVDVWRWHDMAFEWWLDTDLPMLSGRKFRLLCKPKDDVFVEYSKYCCGKGFPAYGRAKFFSRLLTERIHKSRAGVPCSDCALVALVQQAREGGEVPELTAAQKKRLPKAEKHVRAVPIQRRHYRSDRANLKEGDLVIVQDFTKHDKDIHTTTQQDHIIVFYWRENGGEYYCMEHFIGPDGLKNDVRFSMYVWALLQTHERVIEAKRIVVWSDNGPKHFKLSAYMMFMSIWASAMGKLVSLRFNAPYHGACVADSAAAHLKMATERHIARTGDNMKDPNSLVKVANTLSRHVGSLVELAKDSAKPSVQTWKGITKYFHWEALGDGSMSAWETTDDFLEDVGGQRYDPVAADQIPYTQSQVTGRLEQRVI